MRASWQQVGVSFVRGTQGIPGMHVPMGGFASARIRGQSANSLVSRACARSRQGRSPQVGSGGGRIVGRADKAVVASKKWGRFWTGGAIFNLGLIEIIDTGRILTSA